MATTLALPKLPHKLLTLVFLVREHAAASPADVPVTQVLLGMKKRGFGMGKWNGFGGKVEATDASVVAGAAREVQEEANVHVREQDLDPRGLLFFSFEDAKEIMEVHVFLTREFSGEPSESEEMQPRWYDADAIPFNQMWADDQIWLPHVLGGKNIRGHFHFSKDENTILHQELEIIAK